MTIDAIIAAINAERQRADLKFGDREGVWDISEERKLAVLTEEVGEVAEAVLKDDRDNLRQELIQVAAMCVKWLLCLPDISELPTLASLRGIAPDIPGEDEGWGE